jgi:hypothetical protein
MFKSRPNTRKYQPRAATAASLVHLAEQQNKYIRLFCFHCSWLFCCNIILFLVSSYLFVATATDTTVLLYNIIFLFCFVLFFFGWKGGFVYPCGSFQFTLSFFLGPLCTYTVCRKTKKGCLVSGSLYADKAEGRARNTAEQLRNKHRQTRRLQMAGLKSQCVCFRSAQRVLHQGRRESRMLEYKSRRRQLKTVYSY